jgi:hypothetical protein
LKSFRIEALTAHNFCSVFIAMTGLSWTKRWNSMGFPLAQAAVDGVFATVEEIAGAEKINASYVGRVLRLTFLAPISSRRFWTAVSRQA